MKTGGKLHLIRRPLVVVALAPALLLLATVAVGAVYEDRILPRTQVAGLDLGGASAADARERLSEALSPQRPVRVRAGGRELIVRPQEAGFDPDVEATVRRALDAGRRSGAHGLASRLLWMLDPREVEVAARIDGSAFDRMNRAITQAVARKPFPGDLAIDPRTLQASAVPPRAGVEVDADQLQRSLRSALERADRRSITVPTRSIAVPPLTAVQRVATEASAYLQESLRLGRGSAAVTITARRLSRALTAVPTRGARSARLAVHARGRAKLARFVARAVRRPMREAEISAPARSLIVDEKDDLSWRPQRAAVDARPSVTGRVARRSAVEAAIEGAVRGGRHTAPLPLVREEPALTTSEARRVRFLIGTFTTHYPPAQPRVRNIRRIAAVVDGTIIQPGDRFSLNGVSGPRTRAKGYVKAPFIADGKIVPSVGGGVSQFSTTMYNAAYFAGLTINAYRPHSLYIDRYPAGRESTLNYPDIDLAWTNDTEAPVLVRTFSDATSVSVSLYGANGGRRVRAQSSSRRAVPGKEFAITVTRVIRYADGRMVRQPVTTQYDRPVDPDD